MGAAEICVTATRFHRPGNGGLFANRGFAPTATVVPALRAYRFRLEGLARFLVGEHDMIQDLRADVGHGGGDGCGGDLCNRYAVPPFWQRWVVAEPWVCTHGYRCASATRLQIPAGRTGTLLGGGTRCDTGAACRCWPWRRRWVRGDLCHRYAVPPFWQRWVVRHPWVSTHGYRYASATRFQAMRPEGWALATTLRLAMRPESLILHHDRNFGSRS